MHDDADKKLSNFSHETLDSSIWRFFQWITFMHCVFLSKTAHFLAAVFPFRPRSAEGVDSVDYALSVWDGVQKNPPCVRRSLIKNSCMGSDEESGAV